MRRVPIYLLVLALLGDGLFAWGPAGHKWIHARALERLPPPLASILGSQREYLVEHAVDPDFWRDTDGEESPRHFIDLDKYGDFPFPQLTLDYEQMLRRFGLEKLKANGLVLWTIPQVMTRLEKAFRAADQHAILRELVALGHYVADLHQPFHAVANYDGQLSRQWGIHGRFEVEVANRILPTLQMRSAQLEEISDPLKASFDIALESFSRVNVILVADWKIVRDLKIDRDSLPRDPEKKFAVYPESYFRLFAARTGPVAAWRMQHAAWAVASFWTQAWNNSRK
ncbi:MAG: hypothetical protein HY644_04125 [Acidobacteria bacterium]|nr:hypothetical protein [Acidobacteriota bacterium]